MGLPKRLFRFASDGYQGKAGALDRGDKRHGHFVPARYSPTFCLPAWKQTNYIKTPNYIYLEITLLTKARFLKKKNNCTDLSYLFVLLLGMPSTLARYKGAVLKYVISFYSESWSFRTTSTNHGSCSR
jgi:hypothetical protein